MDARWSGLLLAWACHACAAVAPSQPVAAELVASDPVTLERIRTSLATATGRPQLRLGPVEGRQGASVAEISVLPPPAGPMEGRSPVRPEIYDLVLLGSECAARRDAESQIIPLEGVSCRQVGENTPGSSAEPPVR